MCNQRGFYDSGRFNTGRPSPVASGNVFTQFSMHHATQVTLQTQVIGLLLHKSQNRKRLIWPMTHTITALDGSFGDHAAPGHISLKHTTALSRLPDWIVGRIEARK